MADPKDMLQLSDCVPKEQEARENHYHAVARFAVYLNRARAHMTEQGQNERRMIIGVPFPDCIIYLMYAAAWAERDGFDMNAAIDKWGQVDPKDSSDGEDTHH